MSTTETTEQTEENQAPPKPSRQPPYQVLLLDDNDHTYAYVIQMLGRLFGFPEEKAHRLAHDVNRTGRTVVLTTTREHAELKRDQIHAFGRDWRLEKSAGSMSCRITPLR